MRSLPLRLFLLGALSTQATTANAAQWAFVGTTTAQAIDQGQIASAVPMKVQIGKPIKKATIGFDAFVPNVGGISVLGTVVRSDGRVEAFSASLFAFGVGRWTGSVVKSTGAPRRFRLNRGDVVEAVFTLSGGDDSLAPGQLESVSTAVVGRLNPKGDGGEPADGLLEPPDLADDNLVWMAGAGVGVPQANPPKKVKARVLAPATMTGVGPCLRVTLGSGASGQTRARARARFRRPDSTQFVKIVFNLTAPEGVTDFTECAPEGTDLLAGDEIDVLFRLFELPTGGGPIDLSLRMEPLD